MNKTHPDVAYLFSPLAIRERCGNIFARGVEGSLAHFEVDLSRLPVVASRVAKVTRKAYPSLEIPEHSRWNHFQAGGRDRLGDLAVRISTLTPEERSRSLVDLVVVSVLLDAGSGSEWVYREKKSGAVLGRSEGLAVASLDLFLSGGFSSDSKRPYQVDADGLERMTSDRLAEAFQSTPSNPLVAVEGRTELLTSLARVLRERAEVFGVAQPRIGGILETIGSRASSSGEIEATELFGIVLEGFGAIWPGRTTLHGVNLGDTWSHPAAGGASLGAGLVPFHKLSQWLTYSLLRPVRESGLTVKNLDGLTGLAEYRNGGLFVDLGVLKPRSESVTRESHLPGSEVIVEWRALTVILLDRVADLVRKELLGASSPRTLALCEILEGGTWAAGREVAAEQRRDGKPPISLLSDGTVF